MHRSSVLAYSTADVGYADAHAVDAFDHVVAIVLVCVAVIAAAASASRRRQARRAAARQDHLRRARPADLPRALLHLPQRRTSKKGGLALDTYRQDDGRRLQRRSRARRRPGQLAAVGAGQPHRRAEDAADAGQAARRQARPDQASGSSRRAGKRRLEGRRSRRSQRWRSVDRGGVGKPEGPPPMPEGLLKQPVLYTPRAGADHALAASPWAPLVAVAGQKQILLYNTDNGQLLGVLPFPEGTARPQVQPQRQRAAGRRRPRRAFGLRRAVRREDRQADRQGRRRARCRAGRRHQRHAHAGRPRRPAARSSASSPTADGELLHEIKKHTDWIYAVRVQPRRRAAGHGRPQRRPVRLGSRHGSRVSEPARPHRRRSATSVWRLDSQRAGQRQRGRHDQAVGNERRQRDQDWAAHAGGAFCVGVRARRPAGLRRPRQHGQNLDRRRRGGQSVSRLHRSRPAMLPSRTTASAWSAATGSATSRCGTLPKPRSCSRWPPIRRHWRCRSRSPRPTLPPRQTAATAAATELAAAQKVAADKAAALKAAGDKLAAVTAAATKAEADRVAGVKASETPPLR